MYSRSFYDLDGHGWQVMWMESGSCRRLSIGQAAGRRVRRAGSWAAIAEMISAAGMTWVITRTTFVAVVAVAVTGKENDTAVSTTAVITNHRRGCRVHRANPVASSRPTSVAPRITVA